eukprot:TRINITY_DN2627_c0_g1_i1.p1 TRINITY_DN2627_c0_g1~~TRINITY_DN2627_c0_g1_i1.p1  ORF type:complete len:271 (-),score=67.38 TRINITY_DN2627_c0_g1_i1:23-835(-)
MPNFLQAIQDFKATDRTMVPPMVVALMKDPKYAKYDLSSNRTIVSGAAPLSASLQSSFASRFNFRVIQGYGMTELPLSICAPTDKPGSNGILLPNIQAKIVDIITGQLLPNGSSGELWVKCPNMMDGYLDDPVATKQTIDDDGYLHTGDIVYFDEEGQLFIVDRLKELIKYNGNQVAPAELEGILLKHPAVMDAAVVGRPDELAGQLPTAVVVLKPGHSAPASNIADFVNAQVAPVKKLRGGVFFVSSIPKNPSGKILRRTIVLPPASKL